ncbi:MAG TPA: hypothetical protein VF026_06035 [Ktedonobacteraceae bacterium]
MPDLLVRDVPSEVADALSERARAAGMDRQEWLRQHFAQLVQLPVVKVSYTLRFFGPQDEVYGFIKRSPDGKIGLQLRPVALLTLEQRSAFRQAGELVRRNNPGDREKAFKALSVAFEEVYEIPYWNQAQAIAGAESSSEETP